MFGRARDGFARLPSGSKTAIGVSGMLLVIGILIAVIIVLWGRAPQTDTGAYRDLLVDTGGQDLPASTFAGWTGQERQEPPGEVSADPTITEASPSECAPGGELHRRAQNVSRSWASGWSGQTLTLGAYNAQMSIDIANPEPQPLSTIDDWTAACPRTTFVKDGIEHVQKVQVLPVEDDYWGMEGNRVHVVTLTRVQDGTNLGTSTTLHVVSRYRELTMHGALTIRGSVTDNSISTLNLLWERQTMKVRDKESG